MTTYIQTLPVRLGGPPALTLHEDVECYYGLRSDVVVAHGVRGIEEMWLTAVGCELSTCNGKILRKWAATPVLRAVARGEASPWLPHRTGKGQPFR